jgi:hypothetical protein
MNAPDPKASDPHDEIAAQFSRFAAAVASSDVDAFEALCVNDAPPEVDLFQRNAEKVAAEGWKLRIKRIDQEGEVAEVTFDLVAADGEVIDEGLVTFTEEASGWLIRAL